MTVQMVMSECFHYGVSLYIWSHGNETGKQEAIVDPAEYVWGPRVVQWDNFRHL